MSEFAGTAPTRELQCENARCAKRFLAPAKMAGMLVRCPHCDAEMRVSGALDKCPLRGSERLCRVQIVRGPAFLHHEYPLNPKHAYTLGKSDTCEIQIPGAAISRHHAALHHVNGNWVIEDLNSSNGTEVNRRRIVQHELRDGDRIRIGEYLIAFHTPHKSLVAEGPLPVAVAAEADVEPLYLEEPATPAPPPASTAVLPEMIHFEQRREVQATYERAARDARTRTLVWVVALLLGTLGVFWAMGWLNPSTSGRPQAGARRATPMQAAMPPEFIETVRAKRYDEARATVDRTQAAGDGELAGRMGAMLDRAVAQEHSDLIASAGDALRAGDWAALDGLLARAAAPEFARFASEWGYIRERVAARQLEQLLSDVGTSGEYEKLLTLTDDQRRRIEASTKLADQHARLMVEARCGLFVDVTPRIAGATLLIDGRPQGEIGKPIWKLVRGRTTIEVRAAGRRAAPLVVDLQPGELRRETIRLAENARSPLWGLHIVRTLGRPTAIWAAACSVAETPADGVAFKRTDLLALEAAARRTIDLRPPRVATITLKNGDSLVGQYTNAPRAISLRRLPGGEMKTIPVDDVASTEDFEPIRAARLLADFHFRERRAAEGPLATLAMLGELSIQYGATPEATAEFTPCIRECVEELFGACAGCGGLGRVPCPACGGKDGQKGGAPCPTCRGSHFVDCPDCEGDRTRESMRPARRDEAEEAAKKVSAARLRGE